MRNEEYQGKAEQLTVETAYRKADLFEIANLEQKSDLGARYYAAWWLKERMKDKG